MAISNHHLNISPHHSDIEAAQLLGVSVKTMRRWRHEMTGPPYKKLGDGRNGRVVYSEADLVEWLESRTVDTRVA
jgi:DNA-binding transcriptional MerR regulator